jgi:CarboxypepD_reg-like domain/Secretin and TonB N terminus short domain
MHLWNPSGSWTVNIKEIRELLTISMLVCCSFCIRAQYSVSLSHDSAGIETVVTDVENQTSLHFFYDPADFDSLRISIVIRNQPLTKVLDQIFLNSDFHYTILDNQYVLLTRGAVIRTEFNKPENAALTVDTRSEVTGFARKKKVQESAGLENKLLQIGLANGKKLNRDATLVGYVRSSKTGEGVAGATVAVEKNGITVNTDQYGYYQLTVPAGYHVLQIQSFGMMDTRRRVMLNGDGKLNVDMIDAVTSLEKNTLASLP